MQTILDTRVTGTGVIQHPLNGFLGTYQDDAAYAVNGQNATKNCRKIIVHAIHTAVQVTTVVEILTLAGATILSFQLATGATTPRSILPAPIEIDQPIAFRMSGLGVVTIHWEYV